MKSTESFKKKLSQVFRFWEGGKHDHAITLVDEMLETWPGNAQLHIIWASLAQLQETPAHSLDEVKKALRRAIELDENSCAAEIELGHFLDAVEDDPAAAAKEFSTGVALARRTLIDGLLGQARVLLQLGKRKEAFRCLMESLYLIDIEESTKPGKSKATGPDILMHDPSGRMLALQLKGTFASKIERLLQEALANRSA